MKDGKYARIPEKPAEYENLWQRALPLDLDYLPEWVWPGDAEGYRFVGCASRAGLLEHERRDYDSEMADLEAAGMIVDQDPSDECLDRIYICTPWWPQLWAIGIYSGKTPFFLGTPQNIDNPVLTRDSVTDVPAVFVADPFMLRVDGVWHMFFEVMNWQTGRGEIGLASSENGTEWTYQQVVLAEPFHLSYPYVFEWKDDYYMIPERSESGSIAVYLASDFPKEWVCVGDLIRGPYLTEPSAFRYGGRWWLFTETNPDVTYDTLRLFYADEVTGPWREHTQSPIVEGDPRVARPAGRVRVVNGTPIRYAQNCYPDYGIDVRAFEVVELTPTIYREREAVQGPILTPSGAGWNARGMHHIDPHPWGDGQWIACVDGWTSLACGSEPR